LPILCRETVQDAELKQQYPANKTPRIRPDRLETIPEEFIDAASVNALEKAASIIATERKN